MAGVPRSSRRSPATWVGERRWDLRFQTGETVAFPKATTRRAAALVRSRGWTSRSALLGRGFVRFDLRVPGKMIVRLPAGARRADRAGRASRRRTAAIEWPQPADQPLIAALDIGSSKVCAMIAEPTRTAA